MKDWKDALAALRGDMPEVEETVSADVEKAAEQTVAPGSQKLTVLRDCKGRKGKAATIVEGFTLDDEEVAAIARKLRQRLSTGGSSRGGEILLQGDVRTQAADILREMGHKVTVR